MRRADFIRKAKELHPDVGGDPEAFKRLNAEYRLLTGKDKPQSPPVQQLIVEALVRLMGSLGEKCLYVDMIDAIRKDLQNQLAKADNDRKQAVSDHGKLIDMAKRFHNLPFATVFLETQAAGALAARRNAEARLAGLEDAVKALDGARYDFEAQTVVYSGPTTSTGTVFVRW